MIIEGNAFDLLPDIQSKSVDVFSTCLWSKPTVPELRRLIGHGNRIARHSVIIETVANREYHRACVQTEKYVTNEIIWVKHRITDYKSSGRRPLDCTERILVIRHANSFYRDIYTYGRPAHGGARNPGYSNVAGKRALPQVWHGWYGGGERARYGLTDRPQPVWLLEQLFYCYTPPGGSVLEIGAGSGSGWLAAKRLGLQYKGIELNPVMVEAAFLRVSENPVEPEADLEAYMTRQATLQNNRYARNIQREERVA